MISYTKYNTFIKIMSTIILNLTTSQWFAYNDNNDYNRIMRELITPLKQSECIFTSDSDSSFWKKEDKIIIVPSHLTDFVVKQYSQIIV